MDGGCWAKQEAVCIVTRCTEENCGTKSLLTSSARSALADIVHLDLRLYLLLVLSLSLVFITMLVFSTSSARLFNLCRA